MIVFLTNTTPLFAFSDLKPESPLSIKHQTHLHVFYSHKPHDLQVREVFLSTLSRTM
ncbi:hypothetical protein AALP_AA5G186100 [Arabis alpina]|uniref:Uncharacterized protein n=1 Tax=Arabis alpina TaxID=50452 RepID=A0A087GXY3_ARAAL|nr:hypothetical protein AALP_AA5G186100 [Arabis alpina]